MSPPARVERELTRSGWSTERPSLAYRNAFDLCAAEASHREGPVAVWSSSPFYSRELVSRLGDDVLLCLTRKVGPAELELQTRIQPEVDGGRVRLPPGWENNAGDAPRTVLWAEPEAQTWEAALDHLRRLSPPPANIFVLGTTRLRRLLPEWQDAESTPACRPLDSPRPVVRALRRLGYAATNLYGFHGPRSLLWGFASRLPAALGRDDLVDRCFAAVRQDLLVRGWQARWAPVWTLAFESQ